MSSSVEAIAASRALVPVTWRIGSSRRSSASLFSTITRFACSSTSTAFASAIAAAAASGVSWATLAREPSATAVPAALTRIGSPYVWGGGGPGAFDCSGLVQWAFAQAGVFLPHSSYALAAGGQSVSVDQMQPGDVVTQYSDASHVGIYVGDGLMVHASTYGIPVRVESVYNSPIYNVRRY